MNVAKRLHLKSFIRVSVWISKLSIWHCRCNDVSRCCGLGWTPGLGTCMGTCCGCGQKKSLAPKKKFVTVHCDMFTTLIMIDHFEIH